MLNKSKRSRLDSPSQSTSSTQMPAVTNTHPERASDVDKASLDMSAVPGLMVTSQVRIIAEQARQHCRPCWTHWISVSGNAEKGQLSLSGPN